MSSDLLLPLILTTQQTLQSTNQTTASIGTSSEVQDFSAILQLLMMQQLMGSLQSSGSESLTGTSLETSNTGSTNANLQSLIMISLLEQLLSKQLSQDDQSAVSTSPTAKTVTASSQAEVDFKHINQFEAELQVGGDGANANCGPTSLVMALHQLGLQVVGEKDDTKPGEAVDLARLSMASSSAKDGVDARGNRVESEHSTFTDFNDLARGAKAAGATTKSLTPDPTNIIQALKDGASVIVSGTFTGKSPLPWTGDRGSDNQSAPGNAGAHLIEVSAYDSETQLFTIHDPARKKAHQVSAAALKSFMAGNAGALALYRK